MAALVVAGAAMQACGVAERPMSVEDDGGLSIDKGTDSDILDNSNGSCKPWRVAAQTYAAAGTASEVFAVIQPSGPERVGQLIRAGYDDRSITEIATLRTNAPERSRLLLDEGMLYWSDSLDQGADVVKIDPTTGAQEVIAQQQVRPTVAVANTSYVYWGVHGGIMRYKKSDGALERVHDFEPYERVDWIVVTDNTLLYTSNAFAYLLQLVDGMPEGVAQVTQTTRPIGLKNDRLYYLVPSTLTASDKDELMSVSIAGGEPTLEAKEDDIGGPTLLAGGDLMWFSTTPKGFVLVRQGLDGSQQTQTLAGPNGGSLSWTLTQDDMLIWIAGTTLSLLGPNDCDN